MMNIAMKPTANERGVRDIAPQGSDQLKIFTRWGLR